MIVAHGKFMPLTTPINAGLDMLTVLTVLGAIPNSISHVNQPTMLDKFVVKKGLTQPEMFIGTKSGMVRKRKSEEDL